MSEVPKIVYDRLRAASPQRDFLSGSIRTPNLLTAFAEQVAFRESSATECSSTWHCAETAETQSLWHAASG